MKMSVEIIMDNDAFQNDGRWASETINCLKKVIEQLEQDRQWGAIHDTNGNRVGSFDIDYEHDYQGGV